MIHRVCQHVASSRLRAPPDGSATSIAHLCYGGTMVREHTLGRVGDSIGATMLTEMAHCLPLAGDSVFG